MKIYFNSLDLSILITDVKCLRALDTWRKDVQPGDIKDTINEAAPDKIKSLVVSEVSQRYFPLLLQNISLLVI